MKYPNESAMKSGSRGIRIIVPEARECKCVGAKQKKNRNNKVGAPDVHTHGEKNVAESVG